MNYLILPNADMEYEDQLFDQLVRSRGVIVEKLKASRQQIILVASLVDRIPNLAGLARTCEVCSLYFHPYECPIFLRLSFPDICYCF